MLEEGAAIEGDLGKQDDVRRVARRLPGEAAGRRDPAGVPAHHLEHEHLGGGARHGQHVERRLARRDCDVFGGGAESRAAVRHRQIVVDGLGHADADDGIAHLGTDLRHLVGGVHGIVAAVVEEVADVVRAEDLDQPLVLGAILVDSGQLVARRAESAARRVAQRADGGGALLAGVDQILGERAHDAVRARHTACRSCRDAFGRSR